jgi:Cdc6-like AAA superfamily ATPase
LKKIFFFFSYDWSLHRNNYSSEQLICMRDFIRSRKLLHSQLNNINIDCENNIPIVNEHDLNEMQHFAYKLVQYFTSNQEQLLLIINGEGGTGKTHLIYEISKLLKNKLKRCAPTAKAAFLIKGQTLHSLFRVNCTKSREFYLPLSGAQLNLFQHEFKGKLLNIVIFY